MKKYTILILLFLLTNMIHINGEEIESEQKYMLSYFNWRDIDGVDYTTPIRDQSPAPTCEAYALCASMETIMQYKIGELYNPDLSETHLYFYAGGTYESGYVNLVDAANYLIDIGVPDEGCYPDPHRAFDYPFESIDGWENRTIKISNWGWVEKTEEDIKNALIEYGPLIFCAYFWKDFYYYQSGVYKHRWGKPAGGHVMTMVGYDDREQCWICKNSWGTGWGDNGWFKMAYDADMFAEWYGKDTGVMYIDGIYGELQQDTPKIYIEKPKIFKTYFFGYEFSTIIKKLSFQKASPRIIGNLDIYVKTENTNHVEFYIDGVKKFDDTENPFSWKLDTTPGLHTLEVRAINDNYTSIDIVDFYLIG